MKVLIDHNLEGHAAILMGMLTQQGWADLIPIHIFTFKDIDLPIDSSDRVVWQLVQAQQMVLLTANRSMKGEDSLEQVIREENCLDSLPVITLGDADRFLSDRRYRDQCVDRILTVMIDIELWMGVGRLFIP
ncbi:MAG: ACP S-malonyltransferase [Leptolyngbyaceae cyanobacterium]